MLGFPNHLQQTWYHVRYDQCIKASHLFNLLDARGVIGVTERAQYIANVRALAKGCCSAWLESRGHTVDTA